jgi:Ca2+-binding EF-hand superfamily protein
MRACALFGLLLGIAILAIPPSATQGQLPPGDDDRDKEISSDVMSAPDGAVVLFEQFAKGRPYFLISETSTIPFLWQPLAQFALLKGNTSEQITRQEFVEFMTFMRATQPSRPIDPWPATSGGTAGSSTFPGSTLPSAPAGTTTSSLQNPDPINQWADADFERRDANGDGQLNADEMPVALRHNLARWDINQDGLISLSEYRAYVQARLQGTDRDGKHENVKTDAKAGAGAAVFLEEEDWDHRATAMRPGNLPKSALPNWFMECDLDKDGQLSLYEWRKAGFSIKEFKEWDEDDDGYITPTEAIKQNALKSELKAVNGKAVYNGILGSDDPRYEGRKIHKMCRFNMEAGKTYQIDHSSKAFDAYLYLQDPDGKVVSENDDNGSSLDSRIVYKATKTGKYRILATSVDGKGTGAYTLTVRQVESKSKDTPKQPDVKVVMDLPKLPVTNVNGIGGNEMIRRALGQAREREKADQERRAREQREREEKQRREQETQDMDQPGRDIPKWEYHSQTTATIAKLGDGDFLTGLNRLGDDGWELAGAEPTGIRFKRAKRHGAGGETMVSLPGPYSGQAGRGKVKNGLTPPGLKGTAKTESTDILALRNAKATDMQRLLRQLYAKGAMASIQLVADERTNSLLAYGSEEQLVELRRVVSELDRPLAPMGSAHK